MLVRLRSKIVSRTVRFWPLCLPCLHLVHTLPSTLALLKVFRLRNGIPLRQRDIIHTFLSSLTTTCIIVSLLLDCHVFFHWDFVLPCSWVLRFLVSLTSMEYLHRYLRYCCILIISPVHGEILGNGILAASEDPPSQVYRLPIARYHVR